MVTDEVERLLEYEQLFLEASGLKPTLTAEQLTPLSSEERVLLLKQTLEATGALPPNTPLAQMQGLLNVQVASGQAMDYLPTESIPLPIHLFMAMDEQRSPEETQQMIDGWSRYAEVTVHEVPGTHSTMLYEPQVSQLAKEIADCLQAGCD